MKQEDLLKKTGAILNELQEQYQFMLEDPQTISELELELFLANANFLTEHVQILKRISMHKPVKSLPEHAEPTKTEAGNVGPTKVFDDFFTPDKETPTFEFIVNDRADAPHYVAESASQVIEPAGPHDPVKYPSDPVEEPEEQPDEAPYEEPYEPYIEPEEEPVEEPAEAPAGNAAHIHPVYSNMDISSIPKEQLVDEEPSPIETNELELVEEEDEVGPEPFLVKQEPVVSVPEPQFSTPTHTPEPEPVQQPPVAPTPVAAAVPEPIMPVFAAPKVEARIEESAAPHQTHQPTLNELLAASRLGSTKVSEPETSKPAISDLKGAISLNEKLLFVKDLFDGYNLAYAEAIDLLNKMPDFNSADQFLKKHYAVKHNWAAKQGTVDQFYDLLHQRFPK